MATAAAVEFRHYLPVQEIDVHFKESVYEQKNG
jgi:hypothetical protein